MRFARWPGAVGALLLLLPGGCRPPAPNPAAAEVRDLTAAPARLIWCQDAGAGADVAARSRNLRLMGFDTEDGRGERRILDHVSNYAKPMLTPDGRRVIFSDRQEQKIYAVNFDGSGLKALAPGMALAVWRDPQTGTDWVYTGTVAEREHSIFNSTLVDICRRQLNDPGVYEPVWRQTALNLDNFQLSADGRRAGGGFPWPHCGIAALPDRGWKKIGDGCWPSLAPDNEALFWMFDGAHRNLTLFRAPTGKRWTVNINRAPGIGGYEVYHPRWSNHPRFMTMTGPYKEGDGDNRIGGGGREVEIYIGKFSADFKNIERWARVTRNAFGDFFPDLWLADRPAPRPAPAEADAVTADAGAAGGWPGSREGLVFLWQNRSKENVVADPATGRSHACRSEPRGLARYGRYFEMAPAGGAFIAEGRAGDLVDACAASGHLAVEAVIAPDPDPGEGLQPILGYAAGPRTWNFLLGQEGRRLVFTLRAANRGPDYVIPVGELAGDGPVSVLICCSPMSVACTLDGEPAGQADFVAGGNWERGAVVFGNAWREAYPVNGEIAPRGWRGRLEHVALYSRWIGSDEAREKHRALAAALRGRTPAPVVSVEATLTAGPKSPTPESITPYRRALAVGEYRVNRVLAGDCPHRDILVAHWIILDGQALAAGRRRPGSAQRMDLELFSDHPELEGERLIQESERYHLPLYYDPR